MSVNNKWLKEEQARQKLVNSIFNKPESKVISVKVLYTSYDSQSAECYDQTEELISYMHIKDAKDVLSQYIDDNLDISNPDRIEQSYNGYNIGYGHQFEVTYHKQKDIKEEFNRLMDKATELSKLMED